jgi:hypothetical protein
MKSRHRKLKASEFISFVEREFKFSHKLKKKLLELATNETLKTKNENIILLT